MAWAMGSGAASFTDEELTRQPGWLGSVSVQEVVIKAGGHGAMAQVKALSRCIACIITEVHA
jgi:hypothetical protein